MESFVGVDLHKKVSQLAALREPKPASQHGHRREGFEEVAARKQDCA